MQVSAETQKELDLYRYVLNSLEKSNMSISDSFIFMDTDSDGNLPLEELRDGFVKMKISLPIQNVKQIFSFLDQDNSGTISLEEFTQRLLDAQNIFQGNLSDSSQKPVTPAKTPQKRGISRDEGRKTGLIGKKKVADVLPSYGKGKKINGELKVQVKHH